MDLNWDIDWRMMKDMTLLPLFGPRGSAGSTSVRKNEVPEPQGDCSCVFFHLKKNLSWWTPLVHVDWWEPFLKIHDGFFFFRGDDVVFFEVMEINGRYEAVKMLLPSMMETQLGSVTWCKRLHWSNGFLSWGTVGERLWDMHLTSFWFGVIW